MKQINDADIHLLRVFSQVAESGGLSAAQDRLNVSPSTISTQISTLEVRLGFKLCDRGRSGFSLTPEGKVVLDSARQLFGSLEHFKDDMLHLTNTYVGDTCIGLLDSMAHNPNLHLSTAINAFRYENPKHQFVMRFYTPAGFEAAILDGIVDLAIGWTGYELPSLRYEKLFMETQIIYCEKRHPLFETVKIKPTDLEYQDWVRRSYHMPAELPFSRPPISTATASHMEGVAHFVLSGLYIGYLPRHYAQPWVNENRLRAILPKDFSYEINFSLIMKKSRRFEGGLSRFREILHAHH